METLSLEFTKKLNLHNQALHKAIKLEDKIGMTKLLNKLGCIQLDTLNVISRSHNLFFYSRINNYKQEWFNELYKEEKVFEGYTKALCLFPMESYKFISPFKKRFCLKYFNKETDFDFLLDIYNQIKINGPMRSRDFKHTGGSTGNWEMSPIRWALNFLWRCGLIEVIRNNNFEKIYDLVENIIPSYYLEEDNISFDKTVDFFVEKALLNMGVATEKEISNFFKLPKKSCASRIEKLVNSKKIIPIKIQGLYDVHYILTEQFENRRHIEQLDIVNRTFLSPFDNLLWDRDRIIKLFNVDYRLESYLPSHQRKYGYYGMPILINTDIIGVIDLKYDRKHNQLMVKQLTTFNEWRKFDSNKFEDILEQLFEFLGGKHKLNINMRCLKNE